MQRNPFTPFSILPDDVIKYALSDRLDQQSLGQFSRTSRRMYQLLQEPAGAAKLIYLIKKYKAEPHNTKKKLRRYADIENMVKNNPSIIFYLVSCQKLDGTYGIISPLQYTATLGAADVLREIFYEKVKGDKTTLVKFTTQLNEVKDNIAWFSFPLKEIENLRKLCSPHTELLPDIVKMLDIVKLIRDSKSTKIKEMVAATDTSLMFENFLSIKHGTVSPLKYAFICCGTGVWTMLYEKIKNTNELESFIKQLNEVKEDILWSSYPSADLELIRRLCSQHHELSNIIHILDAIRLCDLINEQNFINLAATNPSLMFQNFIYKTLSWQVKTSPLKYAFINCKTGIWMMFYEEIKNTNELENFIKQLNEVKEDIPWAVYPPADLDLTRTLCSQHLELSNVIHILDAAKLCGLIREKKYAEAKEMAAANPSLMFQTVSQHPFLESKVSPLQLALLPEHINNLLQMFHEIIKNNFEWMERFKIEFNEVINADVFAWTDSKDSKQQDIRLLCPQLKLDEVSLFEAADKGNAATVKELLGKGINPNKKLNYKTTPMTLPLHLAAKKGHLEIVKLLLENGANPNICNYSNNATPLELAVKSKHKEIARLLINHDPDLLHHQDDQGNTPLHFAADNGDREIVEMILAYQPDLSTKNDGGETALDFARDKKHQDIVELLENYSANISNDASSSIKKPGM